MHTHQDHIADDSRVLTRGRRVRLFVGAAAFLAVAGTASAGMSAPPGSTLPAPANAKGSPAPSEHNARVAEHLLQQRAASSEHNARVAEYLLLRRGT
jgi:hypothetical protein